MGRLYDLLREGFLWRLDVIALFLGALIIGMNTSSLLHWLEVSDKAARGLGLVVLLTVFWMLAIWWVYLSLMRDRQRAETVEGEAERK